MAKQLTDKPQVHAVRHRDRRKMMPQVVDPQSSPIRFLADDRPCPINDLYRPFAVWSREHNVDGFENQDVAGLTGRLEWKMPIGTLTSISAYRFNKFNRVQDQDGTIAQAYELDSFERDKTFSQELRLSNQTEKLNWVTGVYYYNDRTDRQDKVITGPDYGPAALRNLTSIDHSRLHVESIALFGQASYHFTAGSA